MKWLGILIAFAVFCSLALAVGFPWKQAALLAVFAAYMARGLFQVAATMPLHTFEPYYVLITPNWARILVDYTSAKTEEEWPKFMAWCGRPELPVDWYSVLRNDRDGVLIYRGSEGFRTAIDWRYEVKKKELWKLPKDEISPEGFPDSMDFFVKQKFDVIQLGFSVSKDWWQMFSAHCPHPVEAHEEHMFGEVNVVLAQLPLQEFNLYWNDVDYDTKKVDRTWKLVTESRTKHGWEQVERDANADFPTCLQPIRIKNKYFDVQHQSIK